MSQLRKCDYNCTPNNPNPTNRKGLFHHWGVESIESNDKVTTYTVAIVEDVETGKVVTPMPEWITFTDRQEQPDIHDMSTAD